VQAREGLLFTLLGPPGGRQGLGQRGLLVEQLDTAVADAARLHQHDLAARRQKIGDDTGRVVEEGQPRLHAVELRALGQVLPHPGAPGPARHERAGGPAQRRGDDQLPAAIERNGAQVV